MTPGLALIGHQARLDCDFGREVMISLVLVDHALGDEVRAMSDEELQKS